MRYAFLSYPINENIPLYGATPKPVMKKINDMDSGDHCNTGEFTISNHAGTHVDAPKHFNNGGRTITDYAASELVFLKPLLVDIQMSSGELVSVEQLRNFSDEISSCDMLLIRTGFCEKRSEEIYFKSNPGVSPEAAKYLRTNFPNLKCVGIDSISISSFAHREEGREAHKIFFEDKVGVSSPLLIIEDMNLSGDLAGLSKVFVAPLMMEPLDSAPCAVIAEFATP